MNQKPYPFAKIANVYRRNQFDIMRAADHLWGMPPYEIDWMMLFTPIETSLWYDIRHAGVVLYPQYPIGRFFADFANPRKKIVIECDGKAFHSPEKDAPRDAWMISQGWRVFRLPGKACIQPQFEWSDFDYLEDFEQREVLEKWLDSGESLISAITHVFFDRKWDSRVIDTLHRAIERYEVKGRHQ